MKAKKMIFFFVFFCTLGVNAQVTTCEGVDTTNWKTINTIPINYVCVGGLKMLNPTSFTGFITHIKKANRSTCNELKFIDIKKYNLITFSSTTGGCKQPLVKWSLFDNGTKVPLLKISITQFGTCKVAIGIVFYCLVLKEHCPKEPKVCITKKIIDDKRL